MRADRIFAVYIPHHMGSISQAISLLVQMPGPLLAPKALHLSDDPALAIPNVLARPVRLQQVGIRQNGRQQRGFAV